MHVMSSLPAPKQEGPILAGSRKPGLAGWPAGWLVGGRAVLLAGRLFCFFLLSSVLQGRLSRRGATCEGTPEGRKAGSPQISFAIMDTPLSGLSTFWLAGGWLG